jgi:hypothetical protein
VRPVEPELRELLRHVWRNRGRLDAAPEYALLFFDTLSAVVIAAADTANISLKDKAS